MGALLFSQFRVTNVKLINKKNSLIIAFSKWHGLVHSITFFVFNLLCFKYICNIYLCMLDFNGLCKFNNIFINNLLDYRRNSVIVSQTKNDHLQAYMILMEGKENFFIWNGLIVNRLTGPRLMMNLWNVWGSC